MSVVRPGKSGAEEIQALMKKFRENPPATLAGSPVVTVKDYLSLKATDTATGKSEDMDMPTTSNVLQYFTADGSKVSVRPSGTEPKIKFYMEVRLPMGIAYQRKDMINSTKSQILDSQTPLNRSFRVSKLH